MISAYSSVRFVITRILLVGFGFLGFITGNSIDYVWRCVTIRVAEIESGSAKMQNKFDQASLVMTVHPKRERFSSRPAEICHLPTEFSVAVARHCWTLFSGPSGRRLRTPAM